MLVLVTVVASIFLLSIAEYAHAGDIRSIIFPVVGDVSYSNDWGAPRSGGRTHKGNDLLGYKHQPLISAVDGRVIYTSYPEPIWGFMVTVQDDEGYRYNYLHINDDTPSTDDGNGGGMTAYAPDIYYGNNVIAGQLIGWVGDSGNAESTTPHLHFEILRPDGTHVNPFPTLQLAQKIGAPVISPALPNELLPYGEFRGGATLAYGDVDPRNTGQELITGAGPGGGPHVRVFDTDNKLRSQFFAFPESFRGGFDLATGDLNGDGIDEIIVGAGPGGGPQIRAFKFDGTLMAQFFAYAESFRGGVSVAAADLDGDGIDEIITGAGPGGGPHVRMFDRNGILQDQFFAFDIGFRGGVNVTAGNIDSYSITPEIAAVPAAGGGPHIRVFSYNGTLVDSYTEYEPWWRSGYQIAAGTDLLSISTTSSPRRTSVRQLVE